MIRKLTHMLVFCFAVMACLPTFNCELPSGGPLSGGAVQPFAMSPYYDPFGPDIHQQMTIEERLEGTSAAPQGGAGLMWTWRF